MLAGLIGVGILTGPGAAPPSHSGVASAGFGSVALIFVATLSYAISVHHARRRLQHLNPLVLCAGTMVLASGCLIGPALLVGPAGLPSGHWADVPASAWSAMFALGAVCTALAYTVFFQLIQRLGPTPALTVTFLIPVFGMLWGALFLGETITPLMLLGTAIIAWGTWQSARLPGTQPAAHQTT
jgi:drug/metabolite transporter (DMT)-like permease